MTRRSKLVFSLAVLGGLSLATGCNSLKDMVKLAKEQKLTVNPSPLEVHGGNVGFKMSANLPVKMFKKDTEYEMKLAYVNEGAVAGKEEFKKEVGSAKIVSNDVINSKDQNPKVEKAFSFAYEPKFERGELVVQGVARSTKKPDKTAQTEQVPIPPTKVLGVITTAMLAKDLTSEPYGVGDQGEGTFAFEDHGYGKDEAPKQVFVDFNFEQGSAVLKSVETKDKGAVIDAFVASKVLVSPDGKKVNITGSHSPEGSETINTNLASQRAKAMENYFRAQMKKSNYSKEDLSNVGFDNTSKVLDDTKEEFFSLLDASSLSSDEKSEVKQIMNGEGDFVARERELATKPYYQTLMNEVYPSLRYARTDVYQGPIKRTDAEIASMARTKPEELTEAELLYAASMTPDMNEKVQIYEAAIKKNDSPAAHNNLAAVQLEMALKETDATKKNDLISAAITHLEIAKNKKETAEVNYNLGLAYAIKGDKDKSNASITRAVQLGSNHAPTKRKLKGAEGIMLMQGAKTFDDDKYTQAIAAFNEGGNSHKVLYNKALAQLLSRDYDKAQVSIDEAINAAPNDAHTHYVKAIIGARKANVATMAPSLKKAIELDGNLRAKALKDLEFFNFFNSSEFKDAVR